MGCKNLIANLSKCHEAISLKTHVLKLIFENSLVTAKKQCIFKLEHEMAKLGARLECSNGSFFSTVFKFNFGNREYFM